MSERVRERETIDKFYLMAAVTDDSFIQGNVKQCCDVFVLQIKLLTCFQNPEKFNTCFDLGRF